MKIQESPRTDDMVIMSMNWKLIYMIEIVSKYDGVSSPSTYTVFPYPEENLIFYG